VIDVETPFENLSKRVKEIDVDGQKVLIKPKIKDVEAFITISDKMNEQDAQKLSTCFVNMIERAYKKNEVKTEREDIEDFVAEHYGTIMYSVMELFGFASKEKIENLKKNALDKMGAKFQ